MVVLTRYLALCNVTLSMVKSKEFKGKAADLGGASLVHEIHSRCGSNIDDCSPSQFSRQDLARQQWHVL
jgi:hypothetical protein